MIGIPMSGARNMKPNVYGYCPECGEPGINRERCINGFTSCKNGHKWRGNDKHSITSRLVFERALIAIEEICMMYDPNGNSQALDTISEICEKAFDGRRK